MSTKDKKIKLSDLTGSLLKISFTDWRDSSKTHSVIGTFLKHYEEYKYDLIGHPYSLETGTIEMGQKGVYFEHFLSVSPITKADAELWLSKYKEFHNSVIKQKGYDICSENIDNIKIFSGLDQNGKICFEKLI